MALKTSTDVDHSVEFLSWLFGTEPSGLIYVLRLRPSDNQIEAKQGKPETRTAAFATPKKLDNAWWSEQGHLWNQVFCTSTIKVKNENNKQGNCVAVPAMWVDIDAAKKLGIPGDEFYRELRETEEVSAWTRSSENGIQGWFKLDEPIYVDGEKDNFEDATDLLYDIMYWYGGDEKVVRLGANMRLPGSLNVKAEYDTHYMAQSRIYDDNVYTFRHLRKRFKADPEIVPRIVGYATCRVLADIWEQGLRHGICLQLCGTARKAGINKTACGNLVNEVCKYFGDGEDRSADVATTYERPLDEVATLVADFKEAHKAISEAVEYWVKLKQAYCKAKGWDFQPETYDPTKPPAPTGKFWVTPDYSTEFIGKSGEPETLCNFSIELKGRVVKSGTFTTVWNAVIRKIGEPPTRIEISAEKLSSWRNFNTNVCVGLALLAPNMWAEYIAWLDSTCPDITMVESTKYGILDVAQGTPTMLLPGVPHDNYICAQGLKDMSVPGVFSRKLPSSEAKAFLSKFSDYYPRYHEPRFIYPSLAWLAASSISSFLTAKGEGFPILFVCGLPHSGKSHLFELMLAPMYYGAKSLGSFQGMTTFAIRHYLTTSNVCPFILDEFRVQPDRMKTDLKTLQLQDLMRNLYDHHQIGRGTASGEIIGGELVTPLCIIGEHQFTDEATNQRTFTIRINRNWMAECAALPEKEALNLKAEREWLYGYEQYGKLGSIIIDWVSNNLDAIPGFQKKAAKIVDATTPPAVPRRITSFKDIIAGYFLLEAIYDSYDLDFMVDLDTMLAATYAADNRLAESASYDLGTIRVLFDATDHIIIHALRQNTTLEGTLYKFDSRDPNMLYFDIGRWFREVNSTNMVSQSGTLVEKTAFQELLADHVGKPDSPFVCFPKNNVTFPRNCVQVNVSQVRKLFGVNTDQWAGLDGYRDSD